MTGDPSAQVGEEIVRPKSPYLRIAEEVIDLSLPHFVSKGLSLEKRALASKAVASVLESLHILETLEGGNEPLATAGISATGALESNGHSGADVSNNGLHIAEIVETHPAADGSQNGPGIKSTEASTGINPLLQIILRPVHAYDASVLAKSQLGGGVVESMDTTEHSTSDQPVGDEGLGNDIKTDADGDSSMLDETTASTKSASELPAETTSTKETPSSVLAPGRTITFDRPSRMRPQPVIIHMGGDTVRIHNRQVAGLLKILAANPNRRMTKLEILNEGFGESEETLAKREMRLDHAVAELRKSRATEKIGIRFDDNRSKPRIIFTPAEHAAAPIANAAINAETNNLELPPSGTDLHASEKAVEQAKEPDSLFWDSPTQYHKDPHTIIMAGYTIGYYNPQLGVLLATLAKHQNRELTAADFYAEGFGAEATPKGRGVAFSVKVKQLLEHPLAEQIGISRDSSHTLRLIFRPKTDAVPAGDAPDDAAVTGKEEATDEAIDQTDSHSLMPEAEESFRAEANDNQTGSLDADTEAANSLSENLDRGTGKDWAQAFLGRAEATAQALGLVPAEDNVSLNGDTIEGQKRPAEVELSEEWGITVRFVKNVPHIFIGETELVLDSSPDVQEEICAILAAYFARPAVVKVKLSEFTPLVEALVVRSPLLKNDPFERVIGHLYQLRNKIRNMNSKLAQKIAINSTKVGKTKDGEFEIPHDIYRSPEEVRAMLRNFRYPEAVIDRFLAASK